MAVLKKIRNEYNIELNNDNKKIQSREEPLEWKVFNHTQTAHIYNKSISKGFCK
jgi:hypothetical protein